MTRLNTDGTPIYKALWAYQENHQSLSEKLKEVSGSPAKFFEELDRLSVNEIKYMMAKELYDNKLKEIVNNK